MPDVVPFLTYEDGIAALEWLAEVFGFTETARFRRTSMDVHGEKLAGTPFTSATAKTRGRITPIGTQETATLPS